jgi:exopolysaccharide biosynthesis operon protein EpsL
MSDTVKTLGAGIEADIELGRQQFEISGGGTQVRYNHFSFQDYDGSNRRLVWNWRLGSRVYGELSSSRVVSQSGFTEFQSTLLNKRTVDRDVARINWELHPAWRLFAGREETQQSNSQQQFRISDRDETMDEAGIAYLSRKGSELTLAMRRTDTEFPGRLPVAVSLYGKGNRQDEVILRAHWVATGKLLINGSASAFTREGEGPAAQTFHGVNGRLDASLQATGKSALNVGIWQEYRLADDLNLGFARAEGFRLSPLWSPTSKLQVQADVTHEQLTYLEGDRPDERLTTYGLNVAYAPHEKIRTQLAWKFDERDTSQAFRNYRSNSVMASMQLSF